MAELEVNKLRGISPVWLVPIVALVIALWLGIKVWQETGPTVQITLSQAAGIEVGKTLVKYRDVEVGTVTDMKLSDDFEQVQVYVQLEPEMQKVLSINTRFWVVTPRISLSGVSGLNTLLSGVYIEMDPGAEGAYEDKFQGLSEAPEIRSYDKGTSYTIVSQELGSLDVGAPIYYRQVRVGEVTSYRLSKSTNNVEISIFVESPYDEMIKTRTAFWNVSGFGVKLTSAGVEASMSSVASLISGGLAFSNPSYSIATSEQAEPGRRFSLFPNEQAVKDGAFATSFPYILKFNEAVRGLRVGAEVEFRGIKVGEVTNIELEYMGEGEYEIVAFISIQPERLAPRVEPTWENLDQLLNELIQSGMRAQLSTGSIITGALYIELVPDLMPDQDIALIDYDDTISGIPTEESKFTHLTRQISQIVGKVQSMPFDSIGQSLDKGLDELSSLVSDINQSYSEGSAGDLLDNLSEASKGLEILIGNFATAANSLDQALAPDAQLQHELNKMLGEVSDAATSVEQLMQELSRYPNSLIMGKGEKQ